MSKPTREEIIDALRERIAYLEIHRGRGRITARIHELECMRAALILLEAAASPDAALDVTEITDQPSAEERGAP